MTLRSAVLFLSATGVGLSVYALIQHYGPEGSAVCNFSETFSCDLVNKGPWAEMLGMPVAGVGIAGYAAFVMLALLQPQGWQRFFAAGALAGFAFSLYLTYLEAFVIHAWCLICLASLLDITALSIIGGGLLWRERRRDKITTEKRRGETQQPHETGG